MRKLFFVVIVIVLNLLFINVCAQVNPNAIYKNAIEEINNKQYSDAIELLRSIENTENYLVYFNIGYCYYHLKNDKLAQKYFKKSIKLNNTYSKSYAYLGFSYFYANKLNKSEKAFIQCLNLDNTANTEADNYSIYYTLGQINTLRKNKSKALKYYFKALEYRPDDFNVNYILANIYFFDGNYNNAKKFFEKCDKIDNQIFPVINHLIMIKYKQNNLKDVEQLKQRLRELKQKSADEEVKTAKRFTIDFFDYKKFHVFVEESFDLSAALYYHWVFIATDRNGNIIKTINLESSSIIREQNIKYIVGIDYYATHETTNIMFKELPEYSVMKDIVIKELDNKLQGDRVIKKQK
ncbi:MAG: tetratricopeptide repeat protein [Elusimicrobiota bacterium]|jgi:tetratricopeptide (TPR) repeat protein|nr:tetratricopeptide repeat protein [Elusimicrobiota bacterium]